MIPEESFEAVIEALRVAHKRWPEQRVGQLIANAVWTTMDNVFFATNEDLAKALQEYAGDPIKRV